jgi:hypothetical protein
MSQIIDRIMIELTDVEISHAKSLAQSRGAKEEHFGAMTYGGVRGGLEAHLLGMIPEYAVAKFFGQAVDTDIFDRHGDNGIDIANTKYGPIGVKNSTYKNEPFLRVEIEHFKDSIGLYVLCTYDQNPPNKVWLVGWATKDEVKVGEQKRFLSGGPLNYVLVQEQLHPMKELNGSQN